MRPASRHSSAFSLIELMIAMVFLVIAFFGYVALHARILHSGQRLEEREKIRSATDFYAGVLIARAVMGMDKGPDGRPFTPEATLPGVVRIDTSAPTDTAWIDENIQTPKQFKEGLDQAMQLSPEILARPYTYDWKKR